MMDSLLDESWLSKPRPHRLVLSAKVGGNEEVFPSILLLYVPKGSVVADVTYGLGVFWRRVDPGAWKLLKSDLKTGTDARKLPYKLASLDAVVFDPPYMHSGSTTYGSSDDGFRKHYQNHKSGLKNHQEAIDLYVDSAGEALRVLKPKGIYIVKCQDEVHACKQRLTRVELLVEYQKMGFEAEDIFVVVARRTPGVSRLVKQVHARKNHSYFLVMRKKK